MKTISKAQRQMLLQQSLLLIGRDINFSESTALISEDTYQLCLEKGLPFEHSAIHAYELKGRTIRGYLCPALLQDPKVIQAYEPDEQHAYFCEQLIEWFKYAKSYYLNDINADITGGLSDSIYLEKIETLIFQQCYWSFISEDIFSKNFWNKIQTAYGDTLDTVESVSVILLPCFEDVHDVLSFEKLLKTDKDYARLHISDKCIYHLWLKALFRLVPDNTLDYLPLVWSEQFMKSNDMAKIQILKGLNKVQFSSYQYWLQHLREQKNSLKVLKAIDNILFEKKIFHSQPLILAKERVIYEKEFVFNLVAFMRHVQYHKDIFDNILVCFKSILENKYCALFKHTQQLHIFIKTEHPCFEEVNLFVQTLCETMFIEMTKEKNIDLAVFQDQFQKLLLHAKLNQTLDDKKEKGRQKI